MKYFISGHREISQEEFNEHYVKALREIIKEDPEAEFVVGDYHGADTMAQEWLKENIRPDKVTVYHMFESPRVYKDPGFKKKGGYKTDEERDAAMTKESDKDVAFLRKGKRKSGTAQNLCRRFEVMD